MISIEQLAHDLYEAGYFSVEAAIVDGHAFPSMMGNPEIIDDMLASLWTKKIASELPTSQSYP